MEFIMAAIANRMRILGVALVVEQKGVKQLLSSTDVDSFDLKIHRDVKFLFDSDPLIGKPQFDLHVTGGRFNMSYAQPMVTMPHLTTPGLYLPDMSFRALPAPDTE